MSNLLFSVFPNENFVDIEKPQDSANASIDLNAVTDGQTILINKETELNYSLTAWLGTM